MLRLADVPPVAALVPPVTFEPAGDELPPVAAEERPPVLSVPPTPVALPASELPEQALKMRPAIAGAMKKNDRPMLGEKPDELIMHLRRRTIRRSMDAGSSPAGSQKSMFAGSPRRPRLQLVALQGSQAFAGSCNGAQTGFNALDRIC